MGFKLQTVSECPYTRKSQGIVRMTPELIAELASAVADPDEWAIVLTGERKQKGYLIEVDGYFLPPQDRSGGHVSLHEFDQESNVVGVIHLHPKGIGVFFSTTDTGQLNPRFPMSIVIGPAELQYLGFSYLGTGKVTLPCGATGEVEFKIQPTVGPVLHEVVEVAHKPDDLGKCLHYENQAPDQFHIKKVARCGLSESESLVANAFGESKTLLDVVAALPRANSRFSKDHDTVRNDPDSHWCNKHQNWDFCAYRAGTEAKLKCPECDSTFSSTNTLGKPTLKCQKCKKDVVPVKADRGWLGRYEQSFRDKKSAKKPRETETVEADMIFCVDCEFYDAFENYQCSVCSAPFCQACGEGHSDEFCAEIEEAIEDTVEELKSRGEKQADGCIIIM